MVNFPTQIPDCGSHSPASLDLFLFSDTTILAKIYETNFSVSVKQRTTGKVQFQFLNSFLLVLTKFSFWEKDWALSYNSMKI